MDLDLEENHDKLAVTLCMKKYKQLMGQIYKSYTSKAFKSQRIEQFGSYDKTKNMMKIPDLWKMRGDYGLKDFIKKEEITTLVRLLNTKKKKKKD